MDKIVVGSHFGAREGVLIYLIKLNKEIILRDMRGLACVRLRLVSK